MSGVTRGLKLTIDRSLNGVQLHLSKYDIAVITDYVLNILHALNIEYLHFTQYLLLVIKSHCGLIFDTRSVLLASPM